MEMKVVIVELSYGFGIWYLPLCIKQDLDEVLSIYKISLNPLMRNVQKRSARH